MSRKWYFDGQPCPTSTLRWQVKGSLVAFSARPVTVSPVPSRNISNSSDWDSSRFHEKQDQLLRMFVGTNLWPGTSKRSNFKIAESLSLCSYSRPELSCRGLFFQNVATCSAMGRLRARWESLGTKASLAGWWTWNTEGSASVSTIFENMWLLSTVARSKWKHAT